MRITSLTISGFRAWAREITLDLGGNAVIIVARNGQGKTSLLDAIMWSLTGSVPRLGGDNNLISKYSETGEAFVSIELHDPSSDKAMKISRRFDGSIQTVQVESDAKVLAGTAATQLIIDNLWPTATTAPDPARALLAAFTRSIYLQQDLVRDFIQDQDKQARFSAVSEIIGTGRVTELQMQLDRAKTAWSKVTNERYEESGPSRKRLSTIRDQLSVMRTESADREALETHWTSWWSQAAPIIKGEFSAAFGSPRASSELDRSLKQLYSSEMALGRQMDELRETLKFLATKPLIALLPTESPVSERMNACEAETKKLTAELDGLRKRQKVLEFAEAERSRMQGEMVQLARLALRHLTERCPVCDQNYDANSTRGRLEKVLDGTGLSMPAQDGFGIEIAAKTAELAGLVERRAALASEQLHEAQASERGRLWETERARRVQAFPDSPDKSIEQAITAQISKIEEAILGIQQLRKSGEEMALQVASTSEAQRRAELLEEVKKLKEAVERADIEFEQRNATGELAGRILKALRESATDLVKDQLREIDPVLQSIYETCDPHPALKAVRLVSGMVRGRGQLGTIIEDLENNNARSDDPARILSSSQINVLAVALFLALNLTVQRLPLQCAILDDPLQSLDDLNLLGLIDVLRHVKDQRQLFISTHDVRFGSLLRRKLRPVEPGQRTRIIEIGDWSREGPLVHQFDALHEVDRSFTSLG